HPRGGLADHAGRQRLVLAQAVRVLRPQPDAGRPAPALMLLELAAALCFGAASRDPELPCTNPALRRTVTPTPARARTLPNSPCHSTPPGPPAVCRFGVDGTAPFALVGDSHAGHWRAAFESVAQAKGWTGVSITRSSCPLQKALRDLKPPRRE